MIINILGATAFPVMFSLAVYFGVKHFSKKRKRKIQARNRIRPKTIESNGDSIGKEWHKNKGVIDEAEEFDALINDQEFMQILEEEL
jgi:predicted membrane protein